ncbi:unnamed protein product, partial [Ectocarpus sp. 4 AP-2014]
EATRRGGSVSKRLCRCYGYLRVLSRRKDTLDNQNTREKYKSSSMNSSSSSLPPSCIVTVIIAWGESEKEPSCETSAPKQDTIANKHTIANSTKITHHCTGPALRA